MKAYGTVRLRSEPTTAATIPIADHKPQDAGFAPAFSMKCINTLSPTFVYRYSDLLSCVCGGDVCRTVPGLRWVDPTTSWQLGFHPDGCSSPTGNPFAAMRIPCCLPRLRPEILRERAFPQLTTAHIVDFIRARRIDVRRGACSYLEPFQRGLMNAPSPATSHTANRAHFQPGASTLALKSSIRTHGS